MVVVVVVVVVGGGSGGSSSNGTFCKTVEIIMVYECMW